MSTITTVPTYVAPNRPFNFSVTLAGPSANYCRVWCTDAPLKSALRGQLDNPTRPVSRIELVTLDEGKTWNVPADTFDVGGVYTLVIQEYTRGASSFGGGYQYDPDGAPSETKVGNETTVSLHIGTRLEIPIGVNPDTATLVLWVWDATIRATSVAVHGEKTPVIQADAPTSKMVAVMESASVQTALDALANVAVTTAIGTISSFVSSFVVKWEPHVTGSGSFHNAVDSDNVIPRGLASSPSSVTLVDFVNESLLKMRAHYTNDSGDGRDSASYHQIGGAKVNDQPNMPIVAGVSTPGEAYIGLADMFRSYTAHIASTAVHSAPDSSANDLVSTTSAKLFELHKAILTVLASTAPTVPATKSTGATYLIQLVGAEEKPL